MESKSHINHTEISTKTEDVRFAMVVFIAGVVRSIALYCIVVSTPCIYSVIINILSQVSVWSNK